VSEAERIPLLVIVGPTAVGKTALAVTLAQQLGGEIVSADSRQVYRRMDIGTAKPTAAERAATRHHLIDLIEPDQEFSLATYQALATAAIGDIAARGGLPLLVGGTGQYLAALLEGWGVPEVPPQPGLRAHLEAEAASTGPLALHARLAAIDPVAAAAIAATNVRRVIRAIEVHAVTGQPISTLQRKTPPPYQCVVLWLTLPTPQLYARIDARVDAMLMAGLVAEVQALRAAGYGWELPAMSSLGYREFQPFLAGEQSLAAAVERLKFNTHGFTRKQASWFRRLGGAQQLPADAPDLAERALASIGAHRVAR
jgi:tRNA dimethylallyltransferase